MTNSAVVKKLMPNGMAEVAVMRQTACGGNCGSCEGCICENEVRALANNPVGAKPGQKVLIESKSSRIYRAVIMVYIVPILLFLAGYAAAFALGAGEGVCILVSFGSLIISAAVLVFSQRRKKKNDITFDIIRII